MPEPDGLTGRSEPIDGRLAAEFVSLAGVPTEEELSGPDRSAEHSVLYAVIFLVLAAGSMLLHGDEGRYSEWTGHSIMESVGTILAFIVGALALVRYYSRKQATFLLIGCGFLGAEVLDLNHAIFTAPAILDARVAADPRFDAESMYAWTWTAGRVYLSLFLFVSLLAWRQEVRGVGPGADAIPEKSIYATAIALTVSNLLFFDLIPLEF